jgi:SAM-dependent methyltransferase
MSGVVIPDGPWLNVGSGPVVAPGWTSLDGSWQASLAGRAVVGRLLGSMLKRPVGHWPVGVKRVDVRDGLPYPAESVAVIYASHLLEHLYREEAVAFLRDAWRALKPGGVCRVVVPDVHAIVQWYLSHRGQDAPESSSDVLMGLLLMHPPAPASRWWLGRAAGLHDHKWMYDGEGLRALMHEAGFGDVRPATYLDSVIPGSALAKVEARDRIDNGAGACAEALKNRSPSR